MRPPERVASHASPSGGDEALDAWIASLRGDGAWRVDPVRFHALEALSRRLPGQPEPVRRLLQQKLQTGLADYAERVAAQRQRPASAATKAERGCAPLAQLNAVLAARRDPEEPQQLANARRFRAAWDRATTLDRVDRAVARKPANAGPLNSHMLVLQSLDLMRALSPEYLRRFLGYVETLQWLERAKEKYPRATAKKVPAKAAKAAKGGRRKKPV